MTTATHGDRSRVRVWAECSVFREGIERHVRAEFFNVFNRTQFNNPDSSNAFSARTGMGPVVPTSGFGRINPGSLYSNPLTGQIVTRFQFQPRPSGE
jgi:hypothetical protein